MIKNYLKISLRSIHRSIYHFTLNVVGLVLGISCFVSLAIYVQHELSYDTFFDRPEDLYRTTTYFQRGDQEVRWAITNGGLAEILKNDVPGVEDATRAMSIQSPVTFQMGEKRFSLPEGTGFRVHRNFFNVLNFPVLYGDDSALFNGPNKMVVSDKLAKKMFGSEMVVGKTVELKGNDQPLEVTGVVHVPGNAHMQFEYLISGETWGDFWDRAGDLKRGGYMSYVYFKTHPGVDMKQLENTYAAKTKELFEEKKFPIQPVLDIHFNVPNLFEHAKMGNYNFVRILAIVALLILAIAVINYIILNVSQSIKRSKEIGVRKTLGSSKASLLGQFLTESILVSLIAGLISIGLIELILKYGFSVWFNTTFSLTNNVYLIPATLLFSLLIGLISGIVPAYKISKHRPSEVLRGRSSGVKEGRFNLRTILVTVQFAVTIAIVTGTLVVLKQLSFLRNKDLGFDKEQVINLARTSEVGSSEWGLFKEKVKDESSVASSGDLMYDFISDYNATAMRVIDDGSADTLSLRVQWNAIGYDLLPTLGIDLVEGRNFSRDFASDSSMIIVNEAAKKQLGLASLSDKEVMNYFVGKGKIIGVVNDFHFQSFDKEIIPIAFFLIKNPYWSQNLMVRLQGTNFSQAIAALQKDWREAGIEAPFEYTFLDQSFERLIQKEKKLSYLIQVFAAVTIVIALLGLIGLVSHSTMQRRKEIGIRKVFGSSVNSILVLINRHFLLFIITAFAVAIPFTLWGTGEWLSNFAYKTEVSWMEFAGAAVIILFITIAVITLQSLRAARTNPAKVLKEE